MGLFKKNVTFLRWMGVKGPVYTSAEFEGPNWPGAIDSSWRGLPHVSTLAGLRY